MTHHPSRLVLLGHPVAHSLSPLFQNAALRSASLRVRYDAMDVAPDDLEHALRDLRAERAAGNVTVPYKERVYALCESRTPIADRVGAVNTFWFDARGALSGDNTDVGGFDAMARAFLDVARPQRVALLGAGGAAGAVLAAVAQWPHAEVVIFNRDASRAEQLASRMGARIASSAEHAVADATCVVNATTVGVEGDAHPVPIGATSPEAVLLDLVYRRSGTPWIREARALGRRASDGLPMLLEQGALAFERWFGMRAPRDAMRAALE